MTEPLFTPPTRRLEEISLSSLVGLTRTAKSTTTKAIAALGPTSAILVTPDPSSTPDAPRYRILDGSRRAHDAEAEGYATIYAVIIEGARSALLSAALSANLNRSPNPADQATHLRALCEELGGVTDDNLRAIATTTGANLAALRKTARLLTLPDDLMTHIGTRISPTVAEEIANLPAEIQTQAIEAARLKLSESDKARFTSDDLKAAKAAKNNLLSNLIAGAFATGTKAPANQPALQFATPREIAAARAAQAAKANGVSLADLIADLTALTQKEQPA